MKIFIAALKKYFLWSFISFLFISTCSADQDLISLFPLNNYDQTLSTWIKSSDPAYDKPLLNQDLQRNHLDRFYTHYFGTSSPWNANYVSQILRSQAPNDIKTIEQQIISNFSNEGKSDNQIGYGENFKPYPKAWIDTLANNINVSQLDNLYYQENNRGIAIDNLHARVLPTEDVHFYSYKLAGQGYPFDNLQMSALWAGTPVYIVSETRDHAWMLVITPDYIGWVKSNGIARTDVAFVNTWIKAAKNKLAAITQTQTSLVDEKARFLLTAYVGSVFPINTETKEFKMMVPAADADHQAVIKYVNFSTENAEIMPLLATPHQFSKVMSSMIGRPYGWGSMYFYNDCSAELKSLLTPFGIWLPRHSSDQVTVGKMVDMTSASPEKRLSYLMENGQPFLTIIYIGGHVVLYVGNVPNPNQNDSLMALTYQNIWGLSPIPPARRAVIGQSVLFPLLLQYPEDRSLASLAAKKFFQVSYLNQLPAANTLMQQNKINIKSLMFPELM